VEGNHGGSYYLLSFFVMVFSATKITLRTSGNDAGFSGSIPKFVSLASAAIADDRCLFGYAKIRRHVVRWRTVLIIFLALYCFVIFLVLRLLKKLQVKKLTHPAFLAMTVCHLLRRVLICFWITRC
jgi:hypothetical protein